MHTVGFSTGALAKGDLLRAIEWCRQLELKAIELSALRFKELQNLLAVVAANDLSDFAYISVHSPTDVSDKDEGFVAATLLDLALSKKWPVIVHPDNINDFDLWRPFGELLYIENMDKRKPRGRTLEELQDVLTKLPLAGICFDIAHARQVDSSMTEAYRILRSLNSKIRQIHFSEVSSGSKHSQVSESAFRSYREVASGIPSKAFVIVESIVSSAPDVLQSAASEIERVRRFLSEAMSFDTAYPKAH